ncbi:MAG: hypothetical protein IPN29_03255 [Saprospiraceae bacterium]|nr:hypothetical protein [Saprospiraceae bacterium]
MLIFSFMDFTTSCENAKSSESKSAALVPPVPPEVTVPVLDTADYDQRMKVLANSDTTGKWPVKTPYPLPGALLPFNRIVAYYGNLYSTRMGILGELPKDEMLEKLNGEVSKWQAADSTTKVIPALHYIAATAQSRPGNGNMYRLRMPFSQIDTILAWAKPINALVFLDVQIGHSSIKEEVSALEPYLKLPNVHLGIDPEFSMKNGEAPGTRIGHFTADDINDAIEILADVVKENKLTPKVLVIHRFTQGMVKNYQDIKIVPEVQVVMDMDGFGDKILKESSYKRYIYKEPVQFTGFKLFYKNDNKNNWKMYAPEELLKFTPKPIYIQYQ